MPSLADIKTQSRYATWIEIQSDRLLHNLRQIRQSGPFGAKVIAVVKANAYGHGLIPIARKIAPEVDYLGVANLRDALEIKENKITTPVFIFGRLFPEEMAAALMEGITLSVSSLEEAEEIDSLSSALNRRTRVHVKVDTGMGRMGLSLHEAAASIEMMSRLKHLYLEGIYTHLPTAEKSDGFAEHQIHHFTELLQSLLRKGISFEYRHASNSAGSVRIHQPTMNMIRPGLMLYGLSPQTSLREEIQLASVLSLKSRVLFVKQLQPGESAGYGREFVAKIPTWIGVLPLGYSHGYPFRASSKAHILYQGNLYPIAGRVSMDYLTIHFGNTRPTIGDTVTLIGEENGQSISAEDIAAWSGTIPYEIVTRLIPTIPRLYF